MTPHAETTDLRAQLVEVTAERDALRARLEGDLPKAMRWLQRKVWRQRTALDTLNRRRFRRSPRRPQRPYGWAAASKAARSGFDSRLGRPARGRAS